MTPVYSRTRFDKQQTSILNKFNKTLINKSTTASIKLDFMPLSIPACTYRSAFVFQ